MKRRAAAALSAGLGLGVVQHAPALTSITPLRRRFMPQLSGISRLPHIALTYNACPDPRSTPQLLDLLARYEVHATFFLLAQRAQQQPALVAAMVEAGHEIGVHGWNHGCVALSRPGTIRRDLHAARNTLEDLTGAPVARYRPPYGVLTTESLLAAQALGLQTVLWSSWGRDWTPHATARSIERTVLKTAHPGGTVLLHHCDREATAISWRRTLTASWRLLAAWHDAQISVGPLREHAWNPHPVPDHP